MCLAFCACVTGNKDPWEFVVGLFRTFPIRTPKIFPTAAVSSLEATDRRNHSFLNLQHVVLFLLDHLDSVIIDRMDSLQLGKKNNI